MDKTEKDGKKDQFVEVAVVTTSGAFPSSGTERVPGNQKIRQQLKDAAAALGLADTTGWVVRVGGREIDAETSYADNGLAGTVHLDWGPREGGGGNAYCRQ